jgi:hypothetical protein
VRAQAEIVREWGADKKITEHMREEVMGGRKTSGITKLYDLTVRQIKLSCLDEGGWNEIGMWQTRESS